ncbi:MAG: hypothetical protein MK082_04415 [Phycisphaerales bacterium]|nr:hypothetical protein [Phycisphaerales bacterium]
MSSEQSARILDITAIERFKAGLADFGDAIKIGLLEADSEIERAIGWLERDRLHHWKRQIQVRNEEVATAKSALFRKQMQGSAKDGRPSVVDEKVALDRAKKRLRNAEDRHRACRRWRNRLEQEYAIYKGHVQGLSTVAERNVPVALATLDRMLQNLEAYVRGESGAQDEINRLIEEDDKRAGMNRAVTEELDTSATNDDTEPNPGEERT